MNKNLIFFLFTFIQEIELIIVYFLLYHKKKNSNEKTNASDVHLDCFDLICVGSK